MFIVDFVTANWTGILAVVLAAHGLALAVANLTPTPKDNEALAKAYRVVEWVAGIITSKAKQ
jgi:hypothetical protein